MSKKSQVDPLKYRRSQCNNRLVSNSHDLDLYLEKGTILVELGQYTEMRDIYLAVHKRILYLKCSQKYVELIKIFNCNLLTVFDEKKKKLLKDEIISILLNYLKEGNFSKKYNDVITICDFLLEITPNNIKLLKIKGYSLFNLKQHDQALKTYQEVLDINPKDVDSWCIRGDILSEINQYNEALKSYERALIINPRNIELLCIKGDILLELGKSFEALNAYEQILKINPYRTEIWRKKGNILTSLGFLDEAQEAYLKLEQLNNKEETGKSKEWYDIDNPINRYHLYK